MLVGIVVAVVAIGGLYLLMGGKDGGINIPIIGSSSPPVHTFAFTDVTPAYESTQINVDRNKQSQAAKTATPDVQAVVTQLLQTGYVAPSTWGDAGAIEDLFTDDAKKQVEPNVDTLTFGADSSATYETLTPEDSKLKVTVLINGDAAVTRAMAQIWFHGLAAGTDGAPKTEVTVTGTVFLVPDGNNWKIEAFGLDRQETPAKVSSPTASTSPSESP